MEPLFPQLGFLPGERELRMTGRPALEVLQMLNPISGVNDAMFYAGRTADTSLSPEERRAALGQSALETGIASLPIVGGTLARLFLRNAPAATRVAVGEAGDVMETLTGARPDLPTEAELDRIFGPQPVEDPTMGPVVDVPPVARAADDGLEAELDRIFGPAPDTELDPNEWPYDVFDEDVPDFEQQPFNPDAEDYPDQPYDFPVDPADQNLQNTPEEVFFAPGYYLFDRIADLTEDDILRLDTNTLRAALDNAAEDLLSLTMDGPDGIDDDFYNLRLRPIMQRMQQELDDRAQEEGAFDAAFADFTDDNALNEAFKPAVPPPLPASPTGMVSTVGRAALDLEQPRYGSYDEVIANLKRLGARESELRTSGIASLRDVEGPITQDMIQEAISADNPLEVIRTGAGSPPDDYYRTLQTVPQYEDNFTPGGQDYREVIIRSPNALGAMEPLRGVVPDDQLSIPESHFLGRGLTNQVVHYRSKVFPTTSGSLNAYHVGEIQSDWAQRLRNVRREVEISRLNPSDAEQRLNAAQDEYRSILSEDSYYSSLKGRQAELSQALEDGLITQREFNSEMLDLRKERSDYEGQLQDLQTEITNIQSFFDLDGDRVVGRNTVPEPFLPEGPLVSSTNDVTQLAIRQAILDAVNSGEAIITFGTGDMAFEMTHGRISGQRTYYDEIVPRQVRQVLRRLKNEYDIEMPELETFEIVVGPEGDEVLQEVRGFRLTPELRQAIADFGMPMFKEGGMVKLNSGLASMAREVL